MLFICVIVLISFGILVGSIPVVLTSNYTFAASKAEVIIPDGASSASSDHFKPQTMKVPKRTTVVWINEDDTLHTVTSGSPKGGSSGTQFDSSYLAAGKTFEHTFKNGGTYEYYCTLHPFMVGKVIVSQNAPSTITSAERKPAIQSDTIVTTNRLYTNPDYDLKIQYPIKWKLSEQDLPSNGIVSFTAPDTKTVFEPAALLIANYQMENGTTLNQFVNFFLKDRYKNSTDHKLITQADTVLDGMPARQLLLYDYDKGLIGSGTTGKVLRILAFDNATNNGYSVKFWSHPQVFDKYLPIAKNMISSLRIGNQRVSEMIPIGNNAEENTSTTSGSNVQLIPVDSWSSLNNGKIYLNRPSSIDNDPNGQRFYVSDQGNNRIDVIHSDGDLISTFGAFGKAQGQFNNPESVAADEKNKIIFVTDMKNNRIEKFDIQGNFLAQWGTLGTGEGQFDHPGALAVDPDNKILYVTDIYNNRIQKFSYDGEFIEQWGSFGTGDGQLNRPAGLAVDTNSSTVYVSDTVNNRIQAFDANGNFLTKWGLLGSEEGNFERPEGMVYSPQHNLLYVADRMNHRIQMFDNEGNFVNKLDIPELLPGSPIKPRDLGLDASGHIYVVDKDNSNIQVFTIQGN